MTGGGNAHSPSRFNQQLYRAAADSAVAVISFYDARYISLDGIEALDRHDGQQSFGLPRRRARSGPPVAHVQVLCSLPQAEELKPGRPARHKLHALHDSRPNGVRSTPSDLRRQR